MSHANATAPREKTANLGPNFGTTLRWGLAFLVIAATLAHARGRDWSNHDVDGTVTQLSKAIRERADDISTPFSLANALYAKHDLDQAIVQYRETLRLKPDFAEAHFNLGIALRDEHDIDAAIAEY